MQTTSRYASRTSASLGEGYSFIALRFGTCNSPKDVLVCAIRMRNSLEQHAVEMEKHGGRYIRPIVLFQAQPKIDNDNITFDKIKNNLIGFGIPEEQIKIKTANKDELKGIDLMSRACEVRYIITVNALKEGWDCPFAYILATLANKTSRVDVEQILGRILRQPYITQHQNPLLNLSYVFTSSNDFRDTVERIILSLQKAGFSKKDFREVNMDSVAEEKKSIPNLFDKPQNQEKENEAEDAIELSIEEVTTIKETIRNDAPNKYIQDLQKQAEQMGNEYNQKINEQVQRGNIDPLAAIIPAEMYYPINESYKEVVAEINLPVFYTKTVASIFSDEEWIPLGISCKLHK